MIEIKIFTTENFVVVETIPGHDQHKAYKAFIKFLMDPTIKRITVTKK